MINEKLTLLLQSDVIDQDTFNYVKAVLDYLLDKKIITKEEQSEVFLTHLAMADSRRKTGEPVAELDPAVLDEIRSDPKYFHSIELWKDLQKMSNKNFESTELDYFYLHIINMLKRG